jgi:hypothetical protein
MKVHNTLTTITILNANRLFWQKKLQFNFVGFYSCWNSKYLCTLMDY